MSLFSAVSAELSKDSLRNFDSNPYNFLANLILESNLQITVVDLESTIKIIGRLTDINRIYNIISTIDFDNQQRENDHTPLQKRQDSACAIESQDAHNENISDGATTLPTKTDVNTESAVQTKTQNRVHKVNSGVTNPLQCKKCLKCFRSLNYLKQHKKMHVKRLLKCDKCNKEFSTPRHFSAHKKIHLEPDKQCVRVTRYSATKVLCGLCDNLFEDKITLKEHILATHISTTDYDVAKEKSNSLLPVSINSENDAMNEKHSDDHDVSNDVSNNSVSKDVESRGSVSSSLVCRYCSFVGKNRSKVRDHEHRLHLKMAKKYACTICDKAFGYNKDLTRHMISHKDRKYSCPVCGKRYRHERQMLVHSKTHDESYVAPRINCDLCPKSFSTKSVLQNHVKSEHLGQKNSYLCQTCGKQFTQKRTYHQHVNVHLGIKPFICDICGVPFSYQKSLKDHMLMHSNIRKYQCDVCHKSFKQSSGLLTHRKIHSDKRDYSCAYCKREFTQKTSLVRHERIHLGTKPYSCNLCHEMFRDVSVIRRHLIMVHKCNAKTWKDDMSRIPPNDTNKYFVEPREIERTDIGILLLNNTTMPVDLLCQ